MSKSTFYLRTDLPDAVAALVYAHVGEQSLLKLALPGDMRPDGCFGQSWLVMSEARLAVVSAEPDGTALLLCLHDVPHVQELLMTSGISSAVVEVDKAGVRHRLLRVSNACQKDFAEAARLVNMWIKEKAWKPEMLDEKRNICTRCRRPLPENMNVCPHCVDKRMMIRRVLAFLPPYRREVVRLFVLMVAITLVGLVTPYIGKVLVDDVLKPMQNAHWLFYLAGAMVALYAAQNLIQLLMGRTSARIGTGAVHDIRAVIFRKLQELSLSFYSRHPAGSLITRVNQDTGQLQNLLVDFVPYGVSSILSAIGILALLLYLSWFLTLFVMAPIVGMVFFAWKSFPRFFVYWDRYFEKRSRLNAFVENVISGVRVVKAFAQEPAENDRFGERSRAFRDATYHAEARWAVVMPMIQMLAMLGTPIVWLVGGLLAFKGKMTLGDIIAFTGYVAMIFRPVFILTRLAQIVPNTLAAAGRVFDIIDAKPEIADAPDAVPMPDIRGAIEFRDVSFGYDSNKPVLHGVTLAIGQREMIGLVGHSGAGKSTVVNLICRLFEVNSGQILIDGIDVRKIKYADLRSQIGLVMQETFLLNGTIAENIAYGRPGAGLDDVISAARAANAHDFIINKPDGYDTELSHGGANLSSGEKQRLAIARAILCNPRILILDEATASVDLETEKQIQDAIARLVKERTTIAIAHRLSTLRNAQRLVVMEKGKVAEIGTHEELLKKTDGIYQKLVKLHQDTSGLRAIDR
jgi:ATP-binding cassette subfamily B protein